MDFLATCTAPTHSTSPVLDCNVLAGKKVVLLHPPIAVIHLKHVLAEERKRRCITGVTIVSKLPISKGAADTTFY